MKYALPSAAHWKGGLVALGEAVLAGVAARDGVTGGLALRLSGVTDGDGVLEPVPDDEGVSEADGVPDCSLALTEGVAEADGVMLALTDVDGVLEGVTEGVGELEAVCEARSGVWLQLTSV